MTQDQLIALVITLMPIIVSVAAGLYHALLSKMPANQRAEAEKIVAQVVPAVEQVYKALPGSGADKKARALQLASSILARARIKVSPELLDVLVESAVRSLPR